MFDTVLIANRGEIALRVMRACKELGLRTAAVYSEADRDAPHVTYADDAFLIGPAPAPHSYLDGDRIIAAARAAGAGAIHPGYGFLAENAAFARACDNAGLVFIGPPAQAMERMGGKVAARKEAKAAGVPLVPGTLKPVGSPEEVIALAQEFGYPVAIKAVGGGGGRGLRVVRSATDAAEAFASARREAESAFKNPELYVEKYLDDPRHIEIQVLADTYGNVIHLGERDCSVQRRHQKLIEEAPSTVLTPALRAAMGSAAVALTKSVGYTSAGTLEFLFQDGQFYFLEMNTRIQVEHTVTEMVTGIDLVQAQIRIARGDRLWLTQDQVTWRGHAIECRINAEDAAAGFRPALGRIDDYQEPVGYGVRVDSGVRSGYAIPQNYDSMLSKLIAWGADRAEALGRMRRALNDYRVTGITTTIPFHQLALGHQVFIKGNATVNFIPRYLNEALQQLASPPPAQPSNADDRDNIGMESARTFTVEVNNRRYDVRVAEHGTTPKMQAVNGVPRARSRSNNNGHHRSTTSNDVVSPLQGAILNVRATPGQTVAAGDVLFIIEAMKMENEIVAPHAGTLDEVRVQIGQVIEAGALLATYKA